MYVLPPSSHCYCSSSALAVKNDEILDPEAAAQTRTSYKTFLNEQLAAAELYIPTASHTLQGQWNGLVWPTSADAVRDPETGVARDTLLRVGRASVTTPKDFVRSASFCMKCRSVDIQSGGARPLAAACQAQDASAGERTGTGLGYC